MQKKKKLLEIVRDKIRFKHYSIKTEQFNLSGNCSSSTKDKGKDLFRYNIKLFEKRIN